jgi:hypothetical protein
MKLLDPFSFVVAISLARLASLAPVRSQPAREHAKRLKTGEGGTAVHLAESAFPSLATPGFCEALLKLRPEQGEQKASADFDSEDINRLVQPASACDYPNHTVVPWED